MRAVDLVRHVPLGSAERAGWTLALKALRALDQADGVAGDTSIRIESLRDTGVVLHGPAGGAHVEAARHALLQVPGILDVRIVDPHETDAPRTTAPPVTGWPGEVSVEPEDLPRTAAGAEAPASGGPPSASTQHPREVTVPDDGGDEVADGQQPNRASTDAGGDPTFAPLDEHPDGQSPMENDLDRLPPDQRGTAEADSMPPGSPRRG
ncbi:MAG: hypothetical protein HYX34_12060 [Actinobacteria bacterium]|nr:hypothetical protein [Actinomycetota bacterium]